MLEITPPRQVIAPTLRLAPSMGGGKGWNTVLIGDNYLALVPFVQIRFLSFLLGAAKLNSRVSNLFGPLSE